MYTMNLNLKSRKCIVIGGGRVALRKILKLLESEAIIEVIAPKICAEIQDLYRENRVAWIQKNFSEDLLQNGFLFFAATDDPSINERASIQAKKLGMLVNNATSPDDSDFTVPAEIRRGDLSLAISTNNLSPAFSRFIRQTLESEFPESIEDFLKRLNAIRNETREKFSTSDARIKFWRNLFDSNGKTILQFIKQGDIDSAEEICRHAINMRGNQSSNSVS